MKKVKLLLLCAVFSVCAFGLMGCGNDTDNGSTESGSTTGIKSDLETAIDNMGSAAKDIMN